MQGARPGGGWTNLHHTHLPPDAKKKKRPHNRFCITAFIETKEYRKQGGGGGEGYLKDAWEAREIGEFTQQCSVSPSSKTDASQSCK